MRNSQSLQIITSPSSLSVMHLRNSSALLSSPSTQLQLEFLGKWLGAKRLHRGNTEECLQEKSKEFKKWGLRINRGEGGPDKFRGACGEAEWIRRQSEGFEGKFVVVSLSFATRVWEEGRFIDESIQGGVSGGTSQCLSLCNPNRETCMHVGVFSVVIKLYDLFVPSGCRVGSSVLNLPKDFWLLLLEASVRVSTLDRKLYLVSVFVCLWIFFLQSKTELWCVAIVWWQCWQSVGKGKTEIAIYYFDRMCTVCVRPYMCFHRTHI